MKAKQSIVLNSTINQVWDTLYKVGQYEKWHPFIKKFPGELQLDSPYTIHILGTNQRIKAVNCLVTGLVPGKYFSFSFKSKLGAWWQETEFIFRLSQIDTATLTFYTEIFTYGLGPRLVKGKNQSDLNLKARQMCANLKHMFG